MLGEGEKLGLALVLVEGLGEGVKVTLVVELVVRVSLMLALPVKAGVEEREAAPRGEPVAAPRGLGVGSRELLGAAVALPPLRAWPVPASTAPPVVEGEKEGLLLLLGDCRPVREVVVVAVEVGQGVRLLEKVSAGEEVTVTVTVGVES